MLAKIVLVLLCVTFAIAQVIPGQYIVILNDDTDLHDHLEKINKTLTSADQILHIYETALKGYAGVFCDKTISFIKSQKGVSYVEEDQVASGSDTQSPYGSWGQARISVRSLPLPTGYTYPTSAGSGVNVYVIDTGIQIGHTDFGGRAIWGFNAAGDGQNTDCNGHGTHVASTAVGTKYGIAKKATAVAVKVLTCAGSGSNAGVISGINWVTSNFPTTGKKCVANLSLGGGASAAVDTAVTSLDKAGCVVVVAAGNDNANACLSSPARAATVLTIGSSTISDARSSFSNYGSCVDMFAPGSSITAAWIGSNNAAINTISGTSMAAPHVAGIAAVQLSQGTSTAAGMDAYLLQQATPGKITGGGSGSPNLLAYSA